MRHRGPISPMLFKRHPITGDEIVPVGYVNGEPVWPIMGGAPDESDDDEDDDDDDDDDSGADDTADSKKKSKKGTDSGGADDDDDDDADDAAEALRKRMKAADKRADAAEKRLREIEDAKKDDLTKAQDALTEAESTIEELQSSVKTLRLQNAFLTSNKHTWHDPDTALDLAERQGFLEDVVDEDDGSVDKKRLAAALDKLAKDKPFLIKKDAKVDDDDALDGPSGEPSGGRSDNTKDSKAKKQQLRNRFPVLGR